MWPSAEIRRWSNVKRFRDRHGVPRYRRSPRRMGVAREADSDRRGSARRTTICRGWAATRRAPGSTGRTACSRRSPCAIAVLGARLNRAHAAARIEACSGPAAACALDAPRSLAPVELGVNRPPNRMLDGGAALAESFYWGPDLPPPSTPGSPGGVLLIGVRICPSQHAGQPWRSPSYWGLLGRPSPWATVVER